MDDLTASFEESLVTIGHLGRTSSILHKRENENKETKPEAQHKIFKK